MLVRVIGKMVVGWNWLRFAFGACFVAAQARAQETQPQFVDLTYEIDPAVQGCPGSLEFRSIIAQQLGYDPHNADSTLGIEVRIRPSDSGLEGIIDWTTTEANKPGERRFTSRNGDCREMVTTVGFVVAVQIQLMATEKAASTNRAGGAAEPGNLDGQPPLRKLPEATPTVSLAVKSFELRAVPPSSSPWAAKVGLGPALGLRLAPSALGQGRFFIGLQSQGFEVEAAAEVALPATKRESYGGGFRERLFLGTLALCAWQGNLAACGVGKFGQIHVEGTSVDKPASSSGFVALLGPLLAASLGLSNHFNLLWHVDGLYLLTPWTVDLNQLDVWTMPRFGASVGIDLSVHFQLQ